MNCQKYMETQVGGGGGGDMTNEGFYGTLTADSFFKLSTVWSGAREQRMDKAVVLLDAGSGLARSSISAAFFLPPGSVILAVQPGTIADKALTFLGSLRLGTWRELNPEHDPLIRVELRLIQSCCGAGLPASLDGVECVLCVWHGWSPKDKTALALAFAAAPSAEHLCVVEKAPMGHSNGLAWGTRVAISLTELGFGALEPVGVAEGLTLQGSGEVMHAFFFRKVCTMVGSLAAGEGQAGGRTAKRLLDVRHGDGSGVRVDRFGKCMDQ
jgi:hypothetical protein